MNRKGRIVVIVFVLFLSLVCLLAFGMGSRPPAIHHYIRVLIIKNAGSLDIKIKSPYKVKALYTDEMIYERSYLSTSKVCPTLAGLKIGEKEYELAGVKLEPRREKSIFINGCPYRGSITLIRAPNQTLSVVNTLDIEGYLYGVVPSEMAASWSREALKAQAVAARTYALYHRLVRRKFDYDVTCDTRSQTYKGLKSEAHRANRAVDSTRGMVLTYRGKIFPAFYSTVCGGHTENSRQLWNIEIEPLKGVKCPFCRDCSLFRWEAHIPLVEIQKELSDAGYTLDEIKSIRTAGLNESGRWRQIKVTHYTGELIIPAHKFRYIIGPEAIRSTKFILTVKDSTAHFRGKGWGHNVGMCQWGAYFMAKKGYRMKEILRHYYPGSRLSRRTKHYEIK